MRPLRYARVTDVEGAVATVAADPDSAFLAGGTTEVDLIRLGVARPDRLVDINALPLAERVEQAHPRLDADLVGHAVDGELHRYRVGPARLERGRLGNGRS